MQLRTMYSVVVENAEGGGFLATAVLTTFGSEDKKAARVSFNSK